MKSQDINLEKHGYTFSCNTYPARSHYKSIMRSGRALPITKAQARYFIVEDIYLSVLNADDVEIVETILNKHGFEGDYKYTKSRSWVRLNNQSDLKESLKKEYSL